MIHLNLKTKKMMILLSFMTYLGPKIPEVCESGSMVTLPNENEAVLLGCWMENIYKLTWKGENLQWMSTGKSLQHPRDSAVAILLPDDMTDCE